LKHAHIGLLIQQFLMSSHTPFTWELPLPLWASYAINWQFNFKRALFNYLVCLIRRVFPQQKIEASILTFIGYKWKLTQISPEAYINLTCFWINRFGFWWLIIFNYASVLKQIPFIFYKLFTFFLLFSVFFSYKNLYQWNFNSRTVSSLLL